MAAKVNSEPSLPRPKHNRTIEGLFSYDLDLMKFLFIELASHASRLNMAITSDGVDVMEKPLKVVTYTVASLPPAADWTAGVVFVSNEAGGATLAFSDGTNWRRVQDRVVVS